MVEWIDYTGLSLTEAFYASHKNEWFPQLEQVINIKTRQQLQYQLQFTFH